jgi:hypothetical protein
VLLLNDHAFYLTMSTPERGTIDSAPRTTEEHL